jgi:hypothetical protein
VIAIARGRGDISAQGIADAFITGESATDGSENAFSEGDILTGTIADAFVIGERTKAVAKVALVHQTIRSGTKPIYSEASSILSVSWAPSVTRSLPLQVLTSNWTVVMRSN